MAEQSDSRKESTEARQQKPSKPRSAQIEAGKPKSQPAPEKKT